MKIGVMMCAFRERRTIVPAIRQFDDLGEDIEVVVACSSTPWYGDGKPDDTAEIAVKAGATVRLFSWTDEKDQKNWIMDKMADKDWVLMFAPDMFMTKESLNNLLYSLKGLKQKEKAYACDMLTYWKDYDTIIEPSSLFNTVAIQPDNRFSHSATLVNTTSFNRLPGVIMHHLSWVRTDEEAKIKISTYSHAPEIIPDWYEKIWMKGNKEMTNFNPTQPEDYKGLLPYSLPQELRDLIAKYEIKGEYK